MTDPRLRKLFKGIAGSTPADLEVIAGRAVQAIGRTQRRDEHLREQARLRKAAVERRIEHRKRAAVYARDRRAS